MSLFGSIGSFFSGAVKTVTKIAPKAITAVATGGVSLAVPSVGRQLEPLFAPTTISALLKNPGVRAAVPAVNLAQFLPSLYSSGITTSSFPSLPKLGGPTMGFDLSGILGGLGSLLGGGSPSQALSQLTAPNYGGFPTTYPSTYPSMQPSAYPVSRAVQPYGPGRGAVTQEIFQAGVKVLQSLGLPVPTSTAGAFGSALRRVLSSIGSLARRTPAGTVISILIGLGLTVFESNLLVAWNAQRKRGRRMNAANAKALRRAARRIKSFHKLCSHTDLIRAPRRVGSRSRYCATCRKNPCRC